VSVLKSGRDDQLQPREEIDSHAVLRRILEELRALRALIDEFAGSYLNAKFPYGEPDDRWRRRR
jgi:hypothetical protein